MTLSAVAIALILGWMKAPFVQHLRPVGEFYVALLQMCVLPFLLTTIPLAVRSAMSSGTVGHVVRLSAIWAAILVVAVAAAAVLVSLPIFHVFTFDESTLARIGAFVGSSSDRIDLEFALDPARSGAPPTAPESGLLAFVPTNIFASLASNDSMRVLVFAGIFGVAMVMTERQSGSSIFGALQYIQSVCIMIFDWFGLLLPVGIVALIAPQVALIGPEVYAILLVFACAIFAASGAVLAASVLVVAVSLRLSPSIVILNMLKPVMLGAATCNALVCIPLALETMKQELKVAKEPSELWIPVGFTTVRFGTMLYFIVATLFMGLLMGRGFSAMDLAWIAMLSAAASVATIGASGLAALAPLAAVLRPFGLSYEVAIPLLVIIEPIANMLRTMVNVAVNCAIPALAGGRSGAVSAQTDMP